MKDRIIEHYKSNYNSSPHEITDEEIDFIINHDCECGRCGQSIFELDDFPELLMDENDDEIMCEECYDENYRDICPICENSYDVKDYVSDYIIINEELAKREKMKPGIYKILSRPFFFGNCVTGFDAFFPSSLELAVSIRINEFKKIDCGNNCCEVGNDTICPDCIDKFIRKSGYLKTDSIPCILMKKYEHDDLFKDYTPEQFHRVRHEVVHQRITCRGIIQKANL